MTYQNDNIFAKILRNEIPAKVIYEDDHVLAFPDIAPSAPVHVIVITKKPYVSFDDFTAKATPQEIAGFFISIRKVAEQLGLQNNGYRLVSNHGKDASQSVPHFHMHILGGEPLGAILSQRT